MHCTTRISIMLSCAAVVVALPGCTKKATGQVAAVVNGDEITMQEVSAELGAAKIPDGAEKEKARIAIAQRLVDKRLLEQQAREAGIDRDPDYLLRQRQLNQSLLIELYAKRAQDTLRVPDQAAISKFIADHPTNFAKRTIYTVDQLRFPMPTDPSVVAGLRQLKSLDAVVALLNSKGIKSVRAPGKVDSAQVPTALMQQITAVPAGEPFVIPTPQGVVASVITGREDSPLPAALSQQLAVQMMRSQALEQTLQQRLKEARAKAKITYQPGYGPAATPKT